MGWDKKHVQLRDALSLLIPFSNAAYNLLVSSGISPGFIGFDGSPVTMWNSILNYVILNNQVDVLVNAVLEQFPNNPHLLSFKDRNIIDYNSGPDIRGIEWKTRTDQHIKEKITGPVSTLLPIKFLSVGLKKSKAVARVKIPVDGGFNLGSGFLIENNIFITNNHVISDSKTASMAEIEFDYQESDSGLAVLSTIFRLAPEILFVTSLDEDWTAVKIEGNANERFGSLYLNPAGTAKGNYVNIVQHPGGRYKQIALYHNVVTYADEKIVQYLTDTEPGSSGAPVFNSEWEVVALHHSGGMLTEPGIVRPMLRNEGTSAARIIEGLNIHKNA